MSDIVKLNNWENTASYKKAYTAFCIRKQKEGITDDTETFEISPEFRNARLSFRRSINNSPNSETT